MDIKNIRNKIEQIKGRRDSAKERLTHYEETVKTLKDDISNAEKALELIHKASLQTQSALKFNIETPVTTALSTILEEPYKLDLVFDIKRDRTSCQLLFTRDGYSVEPKEASGGTALDIASVALRIAMHQIASKKSDNVFILDEVFKHVSQDRRLYTGELIKTLCDKLGAQFIMISHDQQHLVSHADKTFTVSMKNGISKVS
jgi:DNA repair exonuclease SbcCD ATPase subunit